MGKGCAAFLAAAAIFSVAAAQNSVTGISSAACGGTSPELRGCGCNPAIVILGDFSTMDPITVTLTPSAGSMGTATCMPVVSAGGTQLTCTLATMNPVGRFDVSVVWATMGMMVPNTGQTVSVSFDAPTVTGASTVACKPDLTGCVPTLVGDTLTITGTGFGVGCGGMPPAVTFAPAGPVCATPMVLSGTTMTCLLTKPETFGGQTTHAVLVDNGIGVSAPSAAATLTYDVPVVTGLSTPLCLAGSTTALTSCSTNNAGVAKAGVGAPGPALLGTAGSLLTVTGENFNYARGAPPTSPFTTVQVAMAGGAVVPCTPVLTTVTRNTLVCSLAVPDAPTLVAGTYAVTVSNGVGMSTTNPATVTWGGATLASLDTVACPATGGVADPLNLACSAVPPAGAPLRIGGSGFAKGFDACAGPPHAFPPCTLPQVTIEAETPGPLYPPPTCQPTATAQVTATGLTCTLNMGGPGANLPPAGRYQVFVTQNGIRSNAGTLTFPTDPVITNIPSCSAAAAPCVDGDTVTIQGRHFDVTPGNNVALFTGSGIVAPSCLVTVATVQEVECTLLAPVGSTGQWTTALRVAGTATTTCTDPQACAIFVRQPDPTITDVTSPVCTVSSAGPTAQLDSCTQGMVTVQGTNFHPGSPSRNNVVFTPVAGSGAGPAPTCAVQTVSGAGDSLTCRLDVSQQTSGRWNLRVDVNGARTPAPPNAPALGVTAGNRNPVVVTPPTDVLLCEDSGPYVVTGWIATVNDGNQNTQNMECILTLRTGVWETVGARAPECVVVGGGPGGYRVDLTFTSAPNYYGTTYYDVQIRDDGTAGPCAPAPCTPCLPVATCELSRTQTFALTILPVNDAPTFRCGGDVAVEEDRGAHTVAGFFSNVTSGGWREEQQLLSWRVTTDNGGIFAVPPRVVHNAGSGSADLQFTAAPNACGTATVTVGLDDDNNNLNTWFNDAIALMPYDHTRGTTYVKDGRIVSTCAHQNVGQVCTFRVIVACVNDPPNFLMGPSPVTVLEDSPTLFHKYWAKNATSGEPNSGGIVFTVRLVDPFHTELFTTQPRISASGDLTFKVAPHAHSLNKRVLAAVQLRDAQGAVSCDVFAVCPMGRCCPEFEIVIVPVNDPPSFDAGPRISVLEDAGPQTFTDWATRVRVGPENEGTSSAVFEQQMPEFTLVAADPSLFATQPALTPSTTCAAVNAQGTVCQAALTFTPAADRSGITQVKVVLRDTGRALARDGTAPAVAEDGSNEALPQWFTIEVKPVNDPPSMDALPATVVVAEDSGAFLRESWVGGVSAGPDDEADQFLRFVLSADKPSLFSVQPTMRTSGSRNFASLAFTPAPDATGSTKVSVVLSDDGGDANGGGSQVAGEFVIIVEPVNDPPSFKGGPNIRVLEDSQPLGGHAFPSWATELLTGGGEDERTQLLEFRLTASTGVTTGLFAKPPEVSDAGALSFTTRPDAFGVSTVSVSLADNGSPPQQTTGMPFTIEVVPVNDAPRFTPGPDLTVEECQSVLPTDPCPFAWPNWASGMSAGPPNEAAQRYWFEVEASDADLFSEPPRVDNVTGTLRFSLRPRANRDTFPLKVRLRDDGGTENGGVDRAEHTLLVLVNPVNSAPFFLPGPGIVQLEDSGVSFYPGWARNISAGGPDETQQTLTFTASATPAHAFETMPTINPLSGDLVFTPAPNFNGLVDVIFDLTDGEKSYRVSSMWTFAPVNDPPLFAPGPAVLTVFENAGPQLRRWVTSPASPGPPDEAGQEWRYVTVVETPNLFAVPPTLHANGTLTFETARDYSGDAVVWIHAVDNGPPPGRNESEPVKLTVRILPVNTAPNFTMRGDATTWEDYGTYTVLGWARDISPGPGEEATTQTVSFILKAANPNLFAVQPAVDPASGDLTFTTALNENGVSDVTIVAEDSGGATAEVQTFRITVEPVNDRPLFDAGPTIQLVEDDATVEFPAWATQIRAGPGNERSQTYNFTVTTDNPGLFAEQPRIEHQTGTLRWRLAADANGAANGEACLTDSGGVAVPGRDENTACLPVAFRVAAVNDAPRIERGQDIVVNEDAGSVTLRAWARSIVPGPIDEILAAQQVETLEVTVSDRNGNAAAAARLFTALPTISKITGDITFHTRPDESGVADFDVLLRDTEAGPDSGGVLTGVTVEPFRITVLPVNDPPDFTPLSDRIDVLEDSPRFRAVWANNIGAGRADETGQSVAFTVQALPEGYVVGQGVQPVVWNYTSHLFSEQPEVDRAGVLTFLPAPNQAGTARFRIRAGDSGGVERGGRDTTDWTYLLINIAAVNDPPSFSSLRWALSVMEDSGRHHIEEWATGVVPGPPNEAAQEVSFHVIRSSLHQQGRLVTEDAFAIWEEPPWLRVVGSTAHLTFQVRPNVWGEVRATVVLADSAGANSTVSGDLVITVTPVNDPPAFQAPTIVDVTEDNGPTVLRGWAGSVTPGPGEEGVQTVALRATLRASDAWLFAVPPSITLPSGDLSFTPAENMFGTAVVTLEAQDNAMPTPATATAAVTINILAVNDPPCFTAGEVIVLPEDAPPYERRAWVKDPCVGPPNEGVFQSLAYKVLANETAMAAFEPGRAPTVSPDGTVAFALRPDVSGTFVFQVVAQDDGGVLHNGVDTSPPQLLVIQVTEVNDSPLFTPGRTSIVVTTADPAFSEKWATGIEAGPEPESAELVDFVVDVGNPGLFVSGRAPSLTPAGTLSFEASGAPGTSAVTVRARDSKGRLGSPVVITVVVEGHGKKVFLLTRVAGSPVADAKELQAGLVSLLPGATLDGVYVQSLNGQVDGRGAAEVQFNTRDLETAFIALAQSVDGMATLRSRLHVESVSVKQGVSGPGVGVGPQLPPPGTLPDRLAADAAADSSGLSAGETVGVVAGVLTAVALLAAAAFLVVRHRRRARRRQNDVDAANAAAAAAGAEKAVLTVPPPGGYHAGAGGGSSASEAPSSSAAAAASARVAGTVYGVVADLTSTAPHNPLDGGYYAGTAQAPSHATSGQTHMAELPVVTSNPIASTFGGKTAAASAASAYGASAGIAVVGQVDPDMLASPLAAQPHPGCASYVPAGSSQMGAHTHVRLLGLETTPTPPPSTGVSVRAADVDEGDVHVVVEDEGGCADGGGDDAAPFVLSPERAAYAEETIVVMP